MQLLLMLPVFLLVGFSSGFRGNSNRGGSTLNSQSSNQLNIGLIAPHTNFGELKMQSKERSEVQTRLATNYATDSSSVQILQLCNNKIFIPWVVCPHSTRHLITTFNFPLT